MGAILSVLSNEHLDGENNNLGSLSGNHKPAPSINNSNTNTNVIYGSGTVTNHNQNTTYVDARPPPLPEQHTRSVQSSVATLYSLWRSKVSISKTLPPMPIVFHGRDDYLDAAVALLTESSTARLAILGAGGMGKTTVAHAILHDRQIFAHYGSLRYFLPCDAFIGADAIVVALAQLFGLPPSVDLLAAVVRHLTNTAQMLLFLDNFETTWLAGGGPVATVDDLIGKLAQIPSLSLIITCRGNDLPQLVEWSKTNSAALEPFSPEAALLTFQDRAGRRLVRSEENTAKQLLEAVDRVPLAVSLLGQLVRHGNTVSKLLNRWNRERSTLLRTHGTGCLNNVEVSIKVSLRMLRAADDLHESLRLLAVCSMLPDGLRPDVFEEMRRHFKHIDRACDTLISYALANIDSDQTLKVLSPIRYHIQEHHALPAKLHRALCLVYFAIADQLPTEMDERYKQLAETAAPEIGNLSSLLLAMVNTPSQDIVDAVIKFTRFIYYQLPTTTLASALLVYVEDQPMWKATCLFIIGESQISLDEYGSAIHLLMPAAFLFRDLGKTASEADCYCMAGECARLLQDFRNAPKLLDAAHARYSKLGLKYKAAQCLLSVGQMLRESQLHTPAIKYLKEAKETFLSLDKSFDAAQAAMFLGHVYLELLDVDSAAPKLETARSTFSALGNKLQLVMCARLLSTSYRLKKEFTAAEDLLLDALSLFKDCDDKLGLAGCDLVFGFIMRDQERWEDVKQHFTSALQAFETLGVKVSAADCRDQLAALEAVIQPPPTVADT